MSKLKKDQGLIAAIIFASVVVSASLTFFGMQLYGGGGNLEEKIQDGIEAYVQKQAQPQQRPSVNAEDFVDDDAFMGDANAPVTIVEFSDFQCPFCKRFADGAFAQLKSEYIDTGKVKLVFRDFPLSFHPAALPASLAAECAREQGGDEAYFKLHDYIFANQDSIPGNLTEASEYYASAVKGMGVKDTATFKACVIDQKYQAEVEKDLQDGQEAGISGTPGFLIGEQMVEGAQPFEAFAQAIEQELAK
ncbi:disulfide bond formation protein DsbA [Candidatus Peregrinibacteria bacterium CG10_big_fil_rev_8_21_14_0_10_36_19]|nr:MAG: disulfide bond formation protein DsbA [Candidatus Peregrinibacteria bacterium CG10_big_fil_rev_8_21_14_0_10_36_19]